MLLELPDPDREKLVQIALEHFPEGNVDRIQAIAAKIDTFRTKASDLRQRPPRYQRVSGRHPRLRRIGYPGQRRRGFGLEEDRERRVGEGHRGMTKRGEIHLGDLARALASLQWQDDAEAKTIAACLGFGIRHAPAPRPTKEIYDRQRYRSRASPPSRPPAQGGVFVPPTPESPPGLPANPLTSRLRPLSGRVPTAPDAGDWLDEEDALYTEEGEPVVARRSLFPERTSRHIVSAALATLRSGQAIDVPSLIAAICRRAPIAVLPRRPEATLERGCQLLLDYSATMVPFWEDLNALIHQVSQVVGPANTQIFSFDTQPTGALCWTPQGERQPWRADGRPVLVATDFGIQGRAGRAEPDPAWPALIERCAQDGSPLVILIPWPEPRWPTDIGGYPELVHWSPHTSAGMVRKKIGQGHRLGR